MLTFCQKNDFQREESSRESLNAFSRVQPISGDEWRNEGDDDEGKTCPDDANWRQTKESHDVSLPFQLVQLFE